MFGPFGNVVQRHQGGGFLLADFTTVYDGFGQQLGSIASVTGLQASAAGSEMIGFGGQFGCWTDNETSMNTTGTPLRRFPWVWMGHREYDPSACRFLTRDPIGYDGGINLYAYCGNNPIMFADPSGLDRNGNTFQYIFSSDFVSDSSQFLSGEVESFNPVNWVKSSFHLGEALSEGKKKGGAKGVMGTLGDAGKSFLSGLQFWNQNDMKSAGRSFGSDLLLVTPALAKIPGLAALNAARASNVLVGSAEFGQYAGKLNYCQFATMEGMKALRNAGIGARLINVTNSSGLLTGTVGDFAAGTRYSTTGVHWAIRVGDRVFDNLTGPKGMNANAWSKATGINPRGIKWK